MLDSLQQAEGSASEREQQGLRVAVQPQQLPCMQGSAAHDLPIYRALPLPLPNSQAVRVDEL